MAAFIGSLIGTGIDFLTWIPAAIAAFAFGRFPWFARFAIAQTANLVLCGVLATLARRDLDPRILGLELLATAIWFGIFTGIRMLVRRRAHGAESR